MVVLLFLAVRVPLLRGGFGSDDDAWRNAANALRMLEEHRYVPSRAPGFPAYDLVLVLLILAGPVATNLASVAFQALACWGVYRIERRTGFARPGLVAAALALAAPFVVTATQTMDYALSAALVTLGCVFLIEGQPRGTGCFLGFATGARASNALTLPAALLQCLAWRGSRGDAKAVAPRFEGNLVISWIVATAVLFTPVVLAGTHTPQSGNLLDHVIRHHANAHTFVPHARGLFSFLLGKSAPLWIGLGLVAGWLRRASGAGRSRPGGAPVFELACALLATAPVFPMILLLLRRVLPAWAFAGLGLMLALELVALPLVSERRIVAGTLLLERAARHEQNERTARLRELPERPSVRIVTRQDLHRLLFSRPPLRRLPPVWEPFASPGIALGEVDGTLQFADSLTTSDRERLAARGYAIVDARGDLGPTRPDPRGPGARAARLGF